MGLKVALDGGRWARGLVGEVARDGGRECEWGMVVVDWNLRGLGEGARELIRPWWKECKAVLLF